MADPADEAKARAALRPVSRAERPQSPGRGSAVPSGDAVRDRTGSDHGENDRGGIGHGESDPGARTGSASRAGETSDDLVPGDGAELAPDTGEGNIGEQLRTQYPWVVRWCLFELRDPASAFDCAQDAMVEVARALPSFEGRSQLKTWMYVIVRRTIGKFRKKERRRGTVFADPGRGADGEANQAAELPDTKSGTPEQQLLQRAELGTVLAAVDRLPEMQRNAVYLYYFEDLPVEECATRLAVSTGTIKTHLSRAREALRSALSDEGT